MIVTMVMVVRCVRVWHRVEVVVWGGRHRRVGRGRHRIA